MSSHKKKTPTMWDNDLREFARRGCKWGRGGAPQKGDDYARKKQELILQCEKNMSTKLSFTPGMHRASAKCTCGYHPSYGIVPLQKSPLVPRTSTASCPSTAHAQLQGKTLPMTVATPKTSALDPTPHFVPTNFPTKPDRWSDVQEIRDQCNSKKSPEPYGFTLESFGPTCGSCVKCGGVMEPKRQTVSKVKTIHTLCIPRFVQGICLKCSRCQHAITTYNKDYVDPLSLPLQNQLDAIVVGRSNSVGMDLVRLMRMGATASSIEAICHANLYARYSAWRQTYANRCHGMSTMGMKVASQDFPPFPGEFVVKGPQLIRAFLRDYISHKI